ncbi:Lrp/AsnC family transcriptional regulator [Burkholderia vietnamiensis]|jgi:DNA-binding Lrp family transcriptional regulator|uniref:Transcriptional regulator, AsnC family n=3 Tax=Burkholderia cepacia complex TaxID=87882 RepID=A4JEK1_BURVG|nr:MULTISPECIES: Lrp/AsnC family transcriptional regulator [Burkholderia]ABO54704.1 transcriptional regulator, AsnC family [Burkholderia vietnamiensis G4]AFJ85923.1 Transcriptional regulator, AsnC family [Burkholderia sp. KJ006]AJY05690.1 asnC-type helix-turn-helix domain protein [Burkholderia vietnamiensis LMG 10929]AOJ13477.1 AsnC family transcriptional regulator [Burkholderia vietnamiensis]AOJ74206.1 AsnC family transcriptional regulator [Burkholderia ubonensis]
MEQLDRIDRGMLDMLQQDGRVSNARLAEAFSLSETSCWRRLRRLEEAGLIAGYHARLDRRKLGFGVMAFVQIVCTQHSEAVTAEFERLIQASPNVLACDNTTGEADFLLQVVAADLDDYSHFVERVLRKLPGVLSIRSNLSLRQLKSTQRLPIA